MCSAALAKLCATGHETVMPSVKTYVVTLSLVALVQCHSYVVEARRVVQGTLVGAPGYPRAYGTADAIRSKWRLDQRR